MQNNGFKLNIIQTLGLYQTILLQQIINILFYNIRAEKKFRNFVILIINLSVFWYLYTWTKRFWNACI